MPTLTPMQLQEADLLIQQGWSQAAAAKHFGVTPPTLCRLLARYRETGDAHAATARAYATGPRDEHQLTPDEIACVKLGMIEKRSRRLAAERLMGDPCCTDETFARLSAVLDCAADKGAEASWPMWWRRACILTAEESLAYRGPKALMRVEPARPRGRFYIEVKEDGSEIQHPLFPGALWKSDDQSENTPSVTIDPVTGKAQVNRQTLYTVDADSAYLLGFTSVARVKDAYTLEDQADHVTELVDAHGMPLRWMIERGPWDNDFWWGCKIPKEWRETEECWKYRFGGIDTGSGGPITVMQAFKSRHKAEIEGAFNHLQNLNAHTSLDIGRFRGEHEAAAKKLRQVQSLKEADRIARAAANFPDQATRADLSAEVVRRFNNEAKRRRMHGGARIVPAELWAQAKTRPVTDDIRWRFLPVKKALAVRNAHISCKLDQHKGREFLFTAEGFKPQWDWQPYLPHGWRVFAVFHPHRLDLGCRIFNAVHPESTKNPGRFPLGMPLGVLPWAEFAPQWREGPGVTGGDFAGRREWHRGVNRQTRVIKDSRKQSVRASFSADNQGKAMSARKGSPDPLNQLMNQGAPPAAEVAGMTPRSGLGQATGSGEADRGRPSLDHEARRNSAGHVIPATSAAAARLAELEAAALADL